MSFFANYWDQKRADHARITQSGKVKIWQDGRRLHVIAPENPDFVKGARELAGRFRWRTKTWSFDLQSRRLVLALVETIYGKGSLIINP